ncbi:hypothetical protein [Helicobacter rodentium]|nr:hypothetical protein [Helicobacter rodentium]
MDYFRLCLHNGSTGVRHCKALLDAVAIYNLIQKRNNGILTLDSL